MPNTCGFCGTVMNLIVMAMNPVSFSNECCFSSALQLSTISGADPDKFLRVCVGVCVCVCVCVGVGVCGCVGVCGGRGVCSWIIHSMSVRTYTLKAVVRWRHL